MLSCVLELESELPGDSTARDYGKLPGDRQGQSKKTDIKTKIAQSQQREKLGHFVKELREALPPVIRPAFRGPGYLGGQQAVMESALRYALELNIDIERLDRKETDTVTAEANSILEGLSDNTENDRILATRERRRMTRKLLIMRKWREVLMMKERTGKRHPRWMVLQNAAKYIKQLEKRKRRLEDMTGEPTPFTLTQDEKTESAGAQNSSQSQADWAEQEDDLHDTTAYLEPWISLSDRMEISPPPSPREQENIFKLSLNIGQDVFVEDWPETFEEPKRRSADTERPASSCRCLLNLPEGSSGDCTSSTDSDVDMESNSHLSKQLEHGSSVESRIAESDGDEEGNTRSPVRSSCESPVIHPTRSRASPTSKLSRVESLDE